MKNSKLNIIHGNRSERLPRLYKEIETQGIHEYEIWPGVFSKRNARANINAAHKQIVEYALLAEFPYTIIAEDDLRFFAPGAWDFFLQNMPANFDIYLGGIYTGDILPDDTVKSFTGFHLYIVHERFYKTFLRVDPYEHIDRALAGLGKFVVCNPMVSDQFDGFSSNTGKDEKYQSLLQGRKLFGI